MVRSSNSTLLTVDFTKGKRLAPGVAYLARPNILKAKSNGTLDLDDIDQAWACVASNVIKKAASEYAGHVKSGKNKDEAFERCSQTRFVAAKLQYVWVQLRIGS
jgi:acyl-CoA oxidase